MHSAASQHDSVDFEHQASLIQPFYRHDSRVTSAIHLPPYPSPHSPLSCSRKCERPTVLVFVERVISAHVLASFLSRLPALSFLRCAVVTGAHAAASAQAGDSASSAHRRQQRAIQEFREGRVRRGRKGGGRGVLRVSGASIFLPPPHPLFPPLSCALT